MEVCLSFISLMYLLMLIKCCITVTYFTSAVSPADTFLATWKYRSGWLLLSRGIFCYIFARALLGSEWQTPDGANDTPPPKLNLVTCRRGKNSKESDITQH